MLQSFILKSSSSTIHPCNLNVADPQPAARRNCSHSGHLLPTAALLQGCTQRCHQMCPSHATGDSCRPPTISVFLNVAKSSRAQERVGVLATPTTHSLLLGCCKASPDSLLQSRLLIENTSPGQLR